MFAEIASNAPAVSPEIDVQTGAEAVATFLADFGQPQGALTQSGGIAPFRHEDDRTAIRFYRSKKLFDFFKI